MTQFALLIICLLAGVILRKTKRLSSETPHALNAFIFHISLPALVLGQVRYIVLTLETWKSALLMWLLFILSFIFFSFLGKFLKWDRKTIGSLILMGGLSNTSFVGFPMLEAFCGHDSLRFAILVDQLGSFLILSSLGILIASTYSVRNAQSKQVFHKVLKFPPIYALLLGLLSRPLPLPEGYYEILSRLAATMTPLALVSTGFQLRMGLRKIRQYGRYLSLGLIFKLVLGPSILFVFNHFIFHLSGDLARITLLESAMAPMITAAILVAEYQLNEELAHLMLGIGIPLSFLTIPLWVSALS